MSGSIVPIQCDLTSRDSLRTAVQQVQQQTPFINCLVSNSGMLGSVKLKQTPYADSGVDEIAKYFWETEEADSGILDINLTAPHWLFAAFLPLLHASNTHPDSVYRREQIDSQFITVSSLSALQKKTLTGYMYVATESSNTSVGRSLTFCQVQRFKSSTLTLYKRHQSRLRTFGHSSELDRPGFVRNGDDRAFLPRSSCRYQTRWCSQRNASRWEKWHFGGECSSCIHLTDD